MGGKNPLSRFLACATKLLLTLAFLSPFYVAICYSFKSKTEIAASGLALPTRLTLDNFIKSIESTNRSGMPFWTVIGNTLTVTLIGTAVLTIFAAMAAYPIARRRGAVYKVAYSLMVLTLLMPIQAYMFPLYDMIRSMKLINTLTGFTLAKIGAQIGYSTIITTGFVKSIPYDIEEAARVDGAGTLRTFFEIVLPLMRPILLTGVVINALNIWNDFALSFIILARPARYIVSLLQFTFIGSNSSELNLAFALFTMSMLPIVALYLVMQKYIIGGITMGSVKG